MLKYTNGPSRRVLESRRGGEAARGTLASAPGKWVHSLLSPIIKEYLLMYAPAIRMAREEAVIDTRLLVVVGNGAHREAREPFQFTRLLDAIAEILGGEGGAEAEEAGRRDSQG